MIEEYLDELYDWQGNVKHPDEWHRRASWNQLIQFHAFGDPSLRVGGSGLPFIKIELNKGLNQGVCADIKNEGKDSAINIDWKIKVTGGLFGLVDTEEHGTIPILDPGKSVSVGTSMFLGFGPISITVEASVVIEERQGIQWIILTQIM
jgi:hypothetical protein